MKKILVEVQGSSRGILMNNPIGLTTNLKMDEKNIKVKGAKDRGTPQEEAEKLAYFTLNKKGKKELYIPSEAFFRSIINASSMQKIGKASAKSVIAGSLFVNPDKILLGTDKYDIDVRTVVIPSTRDRIVKFRPNIKDWKVKFEIDYNEEVISNPQIIYELLKQAGERCGVLDFRPNKSGQFGTFSIISWVPQK